MNYRNILFMTSMLMLVIGLAMAATLGVGICCGDTHRTIVGFACSTAACLIASMAGIFLSRGKARGKFAQSSLREGFVAVFCSWMAAILLGALPFVLCCKFPFADAVFETASGLSTTGASVICQDMPLNDGSLLSGGLEGLPAAILLWRATLNWLGGIGFVMFVLMLLPALGGGKQLYNAEVPGLKSIYDQATPRIATTARIMMVCYALWTGVVIVAYRYCGMDTFFDAVCHAFATVATGGFSTHTASFGYFHAPLLQWIATFAMLVSSFNLMLMARLLFWRKFEFHRDEEVRAFLFLALACTAIFACQMHASTAPAQLTYTDGSDLPRTWEPLLRTASFQVVSIMSTTGFCTSDYLTWALPGLPMLLLTLMLFGGCGGSTAGGLKLARVLVVAKQSLGEIRRKIFPHLMPNVTLNHARIEMPVVRQTMAFVVIYLTTLGVCTLLLPFLTEMDLPTALSAALSAISNVGPGLGKVGPSETYVWLSAPAKYLLAFTMIAGRLELYTAFVVFLPSF